MRTRSLTCADHLLVVSQRPQEAEAVHAEAAKEAAEDAVEVRSCCYFASLSGILSLGWY